MPRTKGATAKAKAAKTKVIKTSEWYATIGRRGGESTKRLHGHDFYVTIGKKGAEGRRMSYAQPDQTD